MHYMHYMHYNRLGCWENPPSPATGGGNHLAGGRGGCGGPCSYIHIRRVIWKMLIRDLSQLVVYFSRPVQRWLVKLCRGLEIDEDARWTLRQRRPRTVPCCDQGRGNSLNMHIAWHMLWICLFSASFIMLHIFFLKITTLGLSNSWHGADPTIRPLRWFFPLAA